MVNFSGLFPDLRCDTHTIIDRAVNEAVSAGMVFVTAAGNDGYAGGGFVYGSPGTPACSHNIIVVGGTDDRDPVQHLYYSSSKGPLNNTKRLAPHLVAPASSLYLQHLTTNGSLFRIGTGTSFSTPMVSSAAALMLDLKPNLAPAETRSLLLLGADWTGPVPCTSTQYERSESSDHCSHAARQTPIGTADPRTLGVLNHVGFGVLNVAESLKYVNDSAAHVVSDRIGLGTPPRLYGLNVTGATGPVKVVLTWLVSYDQGILRVPDLDFTVVCPEGDNPVVRAESREQTTEFAVFDPATAGICTVRVDGSGITSAQRYTLAATHPLESSPSEIAVAGIKVTAIDDGDYLAGDLVSIIVAFPDRVLVDATLPPYLKLDVSPERRAVYAGLESGGKDLRFEYVVQANDLASDLEYAGTDALVAPDDNAIRDARTGASVRPVLPPPGEPGSLSANQDINVLGTNSKGPPVMTSATTVHPDRIAVAFSEDVYANGTDGAGWTLKRTGSGSPRLTVANNTDPDGSSFEVVLTLSGNLPAGAPGLDLAYTQPAIGGVSDADSERMASATIPVTDGIGPSVESILRGNPRASTTASDTLVFRVVFNEPVAGVDRSDFVLSPSSNGSGSILGVTGSGANYQVTVSSTFNGTYNLDIVQDSGIVDAAVNPPGRSWQRDRGGPDVHGRHQPPPATTHRHHRHRHHRRHRHPRHYRHYRHKLHPLRPVPPAPPPDATPPAVVSIGGVGQPGQPLPTSGRWSSTSPSASR